MSLFWELAASGGMLAFLLLLAWRGLAELGWLPEKISGRSPAAPAPVCPQAAGCPAAEYLLCAAAAAGIQWLVLWLGWYFNPPGQPFSVWLYARMTQAGDASHYLYLARYGYARSGEMMNRIVFYPLYPLAVRLAGALTGNLARAGLFVSQSCWAAAAVMLRRLAGRLCASRAGARCAVLAMVLFPFSFFSQGVFTESLFLLLTLSALDAVFAGRWRAAGVLGFLAALCRTQGMLLLFPAVFAWLAARKTNPALPRRSFFWTLCPAAGFGAYLWLNWLYCGSPFAFSGYEKAAPWYQSIQWLGRTVAQQWEMAHSYPGLARFIYLPQLALYFLVLALLLYALLHGAPKPLLLYGGAYLGLCYLQGWMISGGRYVFGCAALYPLLGGLENKWLRAAVLTASGGALLLYAGYYMQGQAIM